MQLGHLICLLVLGGHPQGRNAHQLQPGPSYHHLAQVQVDQVRGDEQRLGLELVLHVHIHQPVHQHCTHVLGDVGLDPEVVAGHSAVVGQLGDVGHYLGQILLFFFSFGFHGLNFDLVGRRGWVGFLGRVLRAWGYVLLLVAFEGRFARALPGALPHEFHINYL